MNSEPLIIEDGIAMFDGNPLMSRNLLFEPVVSSAYLLQDENDVIIFDPSCGKKMGERIESYLRKKINGTGKLRSVAIVAGHSHFDHAGNFYLSDVFNSEESHVYLHERGFDGGQILNDPPAFIEKKVYECNRYYNFYLSFFFPYNVLISPVAALHTLSPRLAARVFSFMGSLPFPPPRNGSTRPQELKEADAKSITVGDIQVRGWEIGGKIVLSTPGHSPCSVSLFWPAKKALFISDAAWLGNPVFMDASVRDCVSTLELFIQLADSGAVELMFSAHEVVKMGRESILEVLQFRLQLIKSIREEVISTYLLVGKEKSVLKLTALLIERSPLFKMLRYNNYPNYVAFPYTIVALCLKEEGILHGNSR